MLDAAQSCGKLLRSVKPYQAVSWHRYPRYSEYNWCGMAITVKVRQPCALPPPARTHLIVVMVALEEAATAGCVGDVARHSERAITVACLLQLPSPAKHVIAFEAEQLLRADCYRPACRLRTVQDSGQDGNRDRAALRSTDTAGHSRQVALSPSPFVMYSSTGHWLGGALTSTSHSDSSCSPCSKAPPSRQAVTASLKRPAGPAIR